MRLPEVLHASPRICRESSVFHQSVLTKQDHIHAQACMHAYKHSHTQTLIRLYYLLDLLTRDKGGNEEGGESVSEKEHTRERVRESEKERVRESEKEREGGGETEGEEGERERETAVEVQEVKVTREKPCTVPDI